MTKHHILNGDSLADTFHDSGIEGEKIVIREAFIEGPVTTDFSNTYWLMRAGFVTNAYGATHEDYQQQFISQLQLLDSIKEEDKVFLWFEDDLFCQANMWFVVYYLSKKLNPTFFRIFPKEDKTRWNGFAKNGPNELVEYFQNRVELKESDISLSNQLWKAYSSNDAVELKKLSMIVSNAFRFLPEVIQAQVERAGTNDIPGRPQQSLIDILNEGKTNFYEIYEAFWERNSIYGFGDLQVYNMLKEMEIEFSGELS